MALIHGMHHVSLRCCTAEEYERALAFYGQVLGLPRRRTWDGGVMFDTGSGLIEVFSSGETPLPQGAVRHFALATGDVDACAAAVRAAGYAVTVEPKAVDIDADRPLRARVAFCIGPVGEEIEFFESLDSGFPELMRRNRSFRGYDESRRLTREELLHLVDCARLSASSVNVQPFRYGIAWEPEPVARIQAMTRWARQLPELELPHAGMCPTGFILICQDTRISDSPARFQRDVGIAAEAMLLAATDLGLGGCMVGNFNAGAVQQTLALPEHLLVQLIVAVGKPAETVVLTEIDEGQSTAYYRDAQDVHYVPKRKLKDIVLELH